MRTPLDEKNKFSVAKEKTTATFRHKNSVFTPLSSAATRIIKLFARFFGCFCLFTRLPHATRSHKGFFTRKLYETLTALIFSRNMHKKVYMFGA